MMLPYITLLTIGAGAAHQAHDSPPLETMADVTNDFGVCVLQVLAAPDVNTVFSPYGLASMALLVYEGAAGRAAAELHNALHLPWHRDVVRIGFRDLHRYLRSYFSSEGFLKGLVLSKPNPPLRPSYVEVLKFYGFQPDTAITQPVLTTQVAIGDREGDNETTTKLPETTTNKIFLTTSATEACTSATATSITTVTPLNTGTETETSEPEKDTTIASTTSIYDQTTNVMTATKKPLTKPEILAMLGPGNGNEVTPDFTTLTPKTTPVTPTVTPKPFESSTSETTVASETTNIPSSTENNVEAQKTTLELTTEGGKKTTRHINMSPDDTNTSIVSEKTTNVMTATNKRLTIPEILAMLGPGNGNKVTPYFTTLSSKTTPVTTKPLESSTLETTVASETTNIPSSTESIVAQKTTLGLTTEGSEKTTRDINMSPDDTNTSIEDNVTQQEIELNFSTSSVSSSNSPTLLMENLTASTTEMDVVTLHVQMLPQLENMNVATNTTNKTDDKQIEKSESETVTDNDGGNNITTFPPSSEDTTIHEVISIIANELTTNDVLNGKTNTDTITVSTLFVDATTLPVDDLLFFTAPPGVDVVPAKDASLLETFLLMTEDNEITTKYNDAIKRSTHVDQALTTPQTDELSEYLELVKNNTDLPNLIISQSEKEVINSTDGDDPSSFNSSWSESTSNEITDEMETNSTEETAEEIVTGFPTLEPDAIIFPTISEPRLPRSVTGAGAGAGAWRGAPLGNWVSAGGWRPSTSDQSWFWTYSGDKLVPVLTYSAHIPHARLPDLQAAAVVLPLDDVRYSLLLLLPDNSRGLKQLLYSLQWHSLRGLLHSLKPKPVHAVVPAFSVARHTNLTPALHKLGVHSVFDAFLANLSDMSDEPHLYVRSIEQVITISVRKYFTDNHWFETSADQVDEQFVATHPFAYFVVDKETKVALVAGTIVDPLLSNS